MTSENRYAGKKKRGRTGGLKDPFERVVVYVPKSVMIDLRRAAERYGTTPENAIIRVLKFDSYALDTHLYTSGVSTSDQQGKLYQELCQIKSGIELDLLLLAHIEFGFDYLDQLKFALSDLLVLGLIEFVENDECRVRKVKAITNKTIRAKDRYTTVAGIK